MIEEMDPRNLKGRVIRQVSNLLAELETDEEQQVPAFRERIAALTAIGRLLMIFRSLRADEDDGRSGAAVRRYAGAFQAVRKRPVQPPADVYDERIDDDDDDAADGPAS